MKPIAEVPSTRKLTIFSICKPCQVNPITCGKIEVHETEFGKLRLRVENQGRATIIKRILEVKNDLPFSLSLHVCGTSQTEAAMKPKVESIAEDHSTSKPKAKKCKKKPKASRPEVESIAAEDPSSRKPEVESIAEDPSTSKPKAKKCKKKPKASRPEVESIAEDPSTCKPKAKKLKKKPKASKPEVESIAAEDPSTRKPEVESIAADPSTSKPKAKKHKKICRVTIRKTRIANLHEVWWDGVPQMHIYYHRDGGLTTRRIYHILPNSSVVNPARPNRFFGR